MNWEMTPAIDLVITATSTTESAWSQMDLIAAYRWIQRVAAL